MTSNDNSIEAGNFIEIPAWNCIGCVLDIRSASLGSEQAIEVLVEQEPDDKCPRWYRLEPNEFIVLE